MNPTFWVELLVFAVGLTVAGVWGGRAERVAASALSVQLALNLLSHFFGRVVVHGVDVATDAGVLVALAAIAYGTNRSWALWATAFQLLAVVSFVGHSLDRSIKGFAYVSLSVLWGWAVLTSLVVGTFSSRLASFRKHLIASGRSRKGWAWRRRNVQNGTWVRPARHEHRSYCPTRRRSGRQ